MGDNPLANLIVSQEAPSEDDGVDLKISCASVVDEALTE